MLAITGTFGEFLKGRTALVTGGTSGIGAAIGRGLAAAGAQVTVTGVSQAEVGAAKADAEFGGQRAEMLDVRDADAVRSLVDGFDRLDVLVNCAGAIRRGAEHDPEVFQQVVDINLNGTMRCCAAARPLLQQSGGAIVNIASMLSFFGGGMVPGYAASKGGVAQLTKSLAIAYAADTIRVNAVARGHVSDGITRLREASRCHASRPNFNPPSPCRRGAGLDRHSADPDAAGRSLPQPTHYRPYADEALGSS